jgi:hypothetical protein
MSRRRLHVRANSGFLRQALERFLVGAVGDAIVLGDASLAEVAPGDIVIAASSACPPSTCREIVATGAAVIMLAPVPGPAEEARYREAGAAAYLPMEANGRSLLNAVNDVLHHEPRST